MYSSSFNFFVVLGALTLPKTSVADETTWDAYYEKYFTEVAPITFTQGLYMQFTDNEN